MGIRFHNEELDKSSKKGKIKWNFDSMDMNGYEMSSESNTNTKETTSDLNTSSRNSKVDLRKLKSDINKREEVSNLL